MVTVKNTVDTTEKAVSMIEKAEANTNRRLPNRAVQDAHGYWKSRWLRKKRSLFQTVHVWPPELTRQVCGTFISLRAE